MEILLESTVNTCQCDVMLSSLCSVADTTEVGCCRERSREILRAMKTSFECVYVIPLLDKIQFPCLHKINIPCSLHCSPHLLAFTKFTYLANCLAFTRGAYLTYLPQQDFLTARVLVGAPSAVRAGFERPQFDRCAREVENSVRKDLGLCCGRSEGARARHFSLAVLE